MLFPLTQRNIYHFLSGLHRESGNGRHGEQIAGCVNMLRNFTGTELTYRADHFFQDLDNIGKIGNWSGPTKIMIAKSKL